MPYFLMPGFYQTKLNYLRYSSHPSLQSHLCACTSLDKFLRKLAVYWRVHEL